ncbi:MAG: hypothetical protein P8Y02_08040 [Deinococcales bacterium]
MEVEHPHPLQGGHPAQVVVGRDEIGATRLAHAHQLLVDLRGALGIVVDDLGGNAVLLGDAVEHLEAATPALAPQRVVGVGDALQLAEHEVGHEEGAVDEVGLGHVGDAPVDDGRGVDDLVTQHAGARYHGCLGPVEGEQVAVDHEER